jgi:hypothetical protein
MAISVQQYIDTEREKRETWTNQAAEVEKDIDSKLMEAIANNLVPNPKNQNFVLRFNFKDVVPAEVKQILKIRYGQAGWTIRENVEYRETEYHGYFDFYKK